MEEIKLNLKFYPEPILRKKAKMVRDPNSSHQEILSKMAQIMYENKGIGLAGPQVGLDLALIVVDIGDKLYKFINPRIIKKEGTQINEEGCLSLPGIFIKVKRSKKIILEALNEYFNPIRLEASDLLACVIQHEMDHLKGKLIIDYLPFWQRLKIKNKLKGAQNEILSKSERKLN